MRWMQAFMKGRYGMDSLNWALLISYLLVSLIARWQHLEWLSNAGLVILVITYFRILSRNTNQRYRENQYYRHSHDAVLSKIRTMYDPIKKILPFQIIVCPICKKTRISFHPETVVYACKQCKSKHEKPS